jgi:hypothetical protein
MLSTLNISMLAFAKTIAKKNQRKIKDKDLHYA